MNNEVYNHRLYQRMTAEQKKYQEWLLTLPPEEILHHVYKYVVRENVPMTLLFRNLTTAQAKALLKSPTPLADVVKEWNKRDNGFMQELWDTLESRANRAIQMEQEKSRDEGGR